MTFTPSQVAKVFIRLSQMNKTQAELERWVASQRGRIEGVLPAAESERALEGAREHWRKLEVVR